MTLSDMTGQTALITGSTADVHAATAGRTVARRPHPVVAHDPVAGLAVDKGSVV